VRHILKPPSRRLTPQQRQQLRPAPTLRNDARTRHTTNNRNTPTTLRTNHPASSYLATARLTTRLAASSCLTISNRCNVSRWFTLLDLFAIPNGQVGLRRARPCFLAFPNRAANSNRLGGNWLAERSRRDPFTPHPIGPAVPNRPAVRNWSTVARWLVHPGRPPGVPRIA